MPVDGPETDVATVVVTIDVETETDVVTLGPLGATREKAAMKPGITPQRIPPPTGRNAMILPSAVEPMVGL